MFVSAALFEYALLLAIWYKFKDKRQKSIGTGIHNSYMPLSHLGLIIPAASLSSLRPLVKNGYVLGNRVIARYVRERVRASYRQEEMAL